MSPRHWKILAAMVLTGWITPAAGQMLGVESVPITVNQMYIGCDALLLGKIVLPYAQECRMEFSLVNTEFDRWQRANGGDICFGNSDAKAKAYAYVKHIVEFFRRLGADERVYAGSKPWLTLAKGAFTKAFPCL